MVDNSDKSEQDRGPRLDVSDLASDEPLDLASAAQSTRSEGVLAPPGNTTPGIDLVELATEPAVHWGLAFLAGSVALRYAPRRAGVWRRRALLGVFCGAQCKREHGWWAYDARVRDAFYAPEDAPRRQLWRRLAFAMEVPACSRALRGLPKAWADGCGAETWAVVTHAVDPAAAKARERVGLAQRLFWSALSSTLSRQVWIAAYTVERRIDPRRLTELAASDDAREVLFLMPAYLSALGQYDRLQAVDTYAGVALVAAAAAGFTRNVLVLRLSLIGGVASLATLIACSMTYRIMVDTADSFKNVQLLNDLLAIPLKDPRVLGQKLPRYELEEGLMSR